MFGFLKKKNNKKQEETSSTDVSHLSDAKRQLFAQLKEKRAELGEEEIQKMANALKASQLKNQMKSDIDNDERKRDRLLDEIRFGMQSDK
jgi:molybdopterin converting factor small subunit